MEYATVEKTNYRSLLVTIWMNLKNIMMSERSHRNTYIIPFMSSAEGAKTNHKFGGALRVH